MLYPRMCLAALRSAVQHRTASVCTCICGLGSVLPTSKSILQPVGGLISYCQPYRNMSLLYYMRKIPKRFKEFKKHHLNVVESMEKASKYPPEIATYLWLIGLKARVRFTNGKWYTSEVKGLKEERPIRELMNYNIDAVDAKGTEIDYHGMAQIKKLQKLRYLSFEGCPYVDDSCLGQLVHLQDSLSHLNINKCPLITECGLTSLHHLSNLERLNMNDLPKVPHRKAIACMLEDVLPKLRISLVTNEVERRRLQRDKWRLPPNQAISEQEREQIVDKRV